MTNNEHLECFSIYIKGLAQKLAVRGIGKYMYT